MQRQRWASWKGCLGSGAKGDRTELNIGKRSYSDSVRRKESH